MEQENIQIPDENREKIALLLQKTSKYCIKQKKEIEKLLGGNHTIQVLMNIVEKQPINYVKE